MGATRHENCCSERRMRDVAAVRCRFEERPHGERHNRIAEHDAELAGKETFEGKGVHCVQKACAETSSHRDGDRKEGGGQAARFRRHAQTEEDQERSIGRRNDHVPTDATSQSFEFLTRG